MWTFETFRETVKFFSVLILKWMGKTMDNTVNYVLGTCVGLNIGLKCLSLIGH